MSKRFKVEDCAYICIAPPTVRPVLSDIKKVTIVAIDRYHYGIRGEHLSIEWIKKSKFAETATICLVNAVRQWKKDNVSISRLPGNVRQYSIEDLSTKNT